MTTTQDSQKRRKVKLIHRDFQIGLMLKFITVQAILLSIFGGALYLFLRGEVEANLNSAHVVYRTVSAMLFPIVITLSLLNLAVMAFTTAAVILYASHRIAGPMFRFNQALKELANRNLRAMTSIRQDDQLAELSTSLAQVRDLWAADVARLRLAAGGLAHALPEGTEETRKHMAEIQAVLAGYEGPAPRA